MLNSNIPKNVRRVINFISDLSDREKFVLEQRFVKKKSLKIVGTMLNVTDSRIQQIEDRLINELKDIFSLINL